MLPDLQSIPNFGIGTVFWDRSVQPFLINDGVGSFLYEPRNKKEQFDMKNWKFTKFENEVKTDAFFDEELNCSIILRSLC